MESSAHTIYQATKIERFRKFDVVRGFSISRIGVGSIENCCLDNVLSLFYIQLLVN